MLTWENLTIAAADPQAQAEWWQRLVGGRIEVYEPGVCVSVLGDGLPELLFLQVLEPKDRKNRLHIDLRPDDQAAEVARAEAMGARRIDVGQGDVSWVVLADPEGNELCILSSQKG